MRSARLQLRADGAVTSGLEAGAHLHRAELGGEGAADAAREDDASDDGRELTRQREAEHSADTPRESELCKLAHELHSDEGPCCRLSHESLRAPALQLQW